MTSVPCRLFTRPTATAAAVAGSINLPGNKSQNYTFLMESDDDSLLSIDGKQVVSDKGAGHSLLALHSGHACSITRQTSALQAFVKTCPIPRQYFPASCIKPTCIPHQMRQLPSVTLSLWALTITAIMGMHEKVIHPLSKYLANHAQGTTASTGTSPSRCSWRRDSMPSRSTMSRWVWVQIIIWV